MARTDIIFLHAPSVYDFRKESLFYGPVSDLVPSTPVFEMYPFGFTTMGTALHEEGYNVRIYNLASMMLNDPKLDVEKLIQRMDASVFGIDLHWLPHAHGSLAIAELVKKHHPEAKVLFGGFSSTYYHEELIRYPQVDLVMKGDSTEAPMIELMHHLEHGGVLDRVQNLTYKEGERVRMNKISNVPENLDHIHVDYGWLVRSVLRYRDLEGFKPFKDWDRYPLTAVFTVRGCSIQCSVCGGSCPAMRNFLNRQKPAFRSPEKVAQDIRNIQDYLKAPTFVVGDVRQHGKDYADRFFAEAKRLGVDNEIILELFSPAKEDFFKQAQSNLGRYSIEFSPDSHDEKVRRALGRNFDTPGMEDSVQAALANGCNRFDLFFMIGLPEQDRQSALQSAEYAARLYDLVKDDKRLFVYSSPLAPFLDPGSAAFENPDKFGYRKLAKTLEDHRVRLNQPSWKYVLSYETKWLNRDDIADASYDVADILNRVRFEHAQISKEEMDVRACRSKGARELMARIDQAVKLPEKEKKAELAHIKQDAHELMESTICRKQDLEWGSKGVLRSGPRALIGLLKHMRD
jgi:B12-binding domain/radical SAM domain protein